MPEYTHNSTLPRGVPVTVGLDQSLTGFGFSVVSKDAPTQHLTTVYRSPFSGVQRLADISDYIFSQLSSLVDTDNLVEDIAMEGTVLASASALKLGELAGIVKITAYNFYEDGMYFVPGKTPLLPRTPLQVPPMTLKKYATGKGNSKKQEMMLQIYKRWGVELTDDNAADAYALARLAGGHADTEVEKAVVAQMSDMKYRDTIL